MTVPALHVRAHGPIGARPIVFLHGVGNTGAMWDRHAAALAGYRCLAPDLPGHGRSRDVPWQSRAETARLIIGLLEGLGRPSALVGLSLGGSVVFAVLERRPDLVDHAIVDGCAAIGTPLAPLMKAGVRLVAPFVRRPMVARMIARSVGLRDAADIADLGDQLRQVEPSSFARAFSDAQDVRISPSLLAAPTKTLLVAGEREIAAVRRSDRELAQRMPFAIARVMPGAPHGWLGSALRVHIAMVAAWIEDGDLPAVLQVDAGPAPRGAVGGSTGAEHP
ncbi:MAG: alpha/beta fold hydrolase [Chloroflexi bacterium]|nr:alpha/beta fold hydrolase [Chloroflexota bacterium]